MSNVATGSVVTARNFLLDLNDMEMQKGGSSELLSCHSFKGLTGPEERRGGSVHTLCPILGIPVC